MTTNRVPPRNGNRANELCLALHGDEDIVVLVLRNKKTLGYFMLDLHMSSLISTRGIVLEFSNNDTNNNTIKEVNFTCFISYEGTSLYFI